MCSLTRLMLFGVLLFATTRGDGTARFAVAARPVDNGAEAA